MHVHAHAHAHDRNRLVTLPPSPGYAWVVRRYLYTSDPAARFELSAPCLPNPGWSYVVETIAAAHPDDREAVLDQLSGRDPAWRGPVFLNLPDQVSAVDPNDPEPDPPAWGEGWEDPEPFTTATATATASPAHDGFAVDAFPPAAQSFIERLSGRGRCNPVDVIGGTMLGVFNSMVGRSVVVQHPHHPNRTMPCSLSVAVVGSTGSGKTFWLDYFRGPFALLTDEIKAAAWKDRMEWEAAAAEAKAAAKEGRPATDPRGAKPPIPDPILTAFSTMNGVESAMHDTPIGVALFVDELGVLLGGLNQHKNGGNERDTLLQLLDCGRSNVRTKAEIAPVRNRSALGVLGGAVPRRVAEWGSHGATDDGLYRRFLWVFPSHWPRPRSDDSRAAGDPDAAAAWSMVAETVIAWRTVAETDGPRVIRLSGEAEAAYDRHFDHVADLVDDPANADEAGAIASIPDQLLKIAAGLQLLDAAFQFQADRVVPPGDVPMTRVDRRWVEVPPVIERWAIDGAARLLFSYFLPSLVRLKLEQADKRTSVVPRGAKLWSKIQADPDPLRVWTRNEFRNKLGGGRVQDEVIESEIAALVQRKMIRPAVPYVDFVPSPQGRVKKDPYVVNPRCFPQGKPASHAALRDSDDGSEDDPLAVIDGPLPADPIPRSSVGTGFAPTVRWRGPAHDHAAQAATMGGGGLIP